MWNSAIETSVKTQYCDRQNIKIVREMCQQQMESPDAMFICRTILLVYVLTHQVVNF